MPKRTELIRRLNAKQGLLPRSITAEFIADVILSATKPYATARVVSALSLQTRLANIRTGAKTASTYHKLIFETLSNVFEPSLIQGKMEEKVDEGRKRIDIVYRNMSTHGFFYELNALHQIFCPYVFVECKNYSRDIENPEFDQLIGRFHDKQGRFGILACREIADKHHALRTCKYIMDAGPNRVMVLEDCDVLELSDLKNHKGNDAVDGFMARKLRDIIML